MDWRRPKEEESVPLILEDSHLTEDALELYCLGMLDHERDVPLVEEHLLYCEWCQQRLEKAQSFVNAARDGAQRVAEEPPQGGGSNPLRIWAIVAVAAAAIALVLFFPKAIEQTPAPLAIELLSLRDQSSIEAPSGRALILRPNLDGLEGQQPFSYRLVTTQGATVAEGPLSGPAPLIRAEPLSPGRYWLRIVDAASKEPRREYSLLIR
jgi:hypothetical protein